MVDFQAHTLNMSYGQPLQKGRSNPSLPLVPGALGPMDSVGSTGLAESESISLAGTQDTFTRSAPPSFAGNRPLHVVPSLAFAGRGAEEPAEEPTAGTDGESNTSPVGTPEPSEEADLTHQDVDPPEEAEESDGSLFNFNKSGKKDGWFSQAKDNLKFGTYVFLKYVLPILMIFTPLNIFWIAGAVVGQSITDRIADKLIGGVNANNLWGPLKPLANSDTMSQLSKVEEKLKQAPAGSSAGQVVFDEEMQRSLEHLKKIKFMGMGSAISRGLSKGRFSPITAFILSETKKTQNPIGKFFYAGIGAVKYFFNYAKLRLREVVVDKFLAFFEKIPVLGWPIRILRFLNRTLPIWSTLRDIVGGNKEKNKKNNPQPA